VILTREIMGALALAILWVNTLLVAAAALKQAGELRRRMRALRPLAPGEQGEGLIEGLIEEGDGEGGALARYEVEQIGRAGAEHAGRRTIHFGDRTFGGAVLGGVVTAGGSRVRVCAGDGEVWPDRADVLSAAACGGQARKARGHAREVQVALRAGGPVWIAGAVRATSGGLEIVPSGEAPLLVSAIEPRAWIRGKVTLAVLFAVAETAIAAGVTALVLVPPVFDGWVSKIGGVLGLGFFLGVQPVGTAVRDALRPPSRAFVRGRWIEPTPEAQRSPKSAGAAAA
jgi:hypothetical protein